MDDPQKVCLSRHQPEDIKKLIVFSQTKRKVYVQRPKGIQRLYKGLKPDNFHGPTRIFWCLLRSSAVDAVRTINPEERAPDVGFPGRWEMVKIGSDEMKIHHGGIEYRVHDVS